MTSATTNRWLKKWDIAQLLTTVVDEKNWKGDAHTHGIFFDQEYGIILNKIMAVRIQHNEETPAELFYSFNQLAPDGSAEIREEYPFQNMMNRPRKQHLLVGDNVSREEINNLFVSGYYEGAILLHPQKLRLLLQDVSIKRHRERSVAFLQLEGQQVKMSVYKVLSRNQRVTLASGTLDCSVLEQPKNESNMQAGVNAHALSYLLNLFHPSLFSAIAFRFGRDRIMITGHSSGYSPKVEVVISRMKVV